MAKYLLVNKNAKEIVDVQVLVGNLNDAKRYFQMRKQYESKSKRKDPRLGVNIPKKYIIANSTKII